MADTCKVEMFNEKGQKILLFGNKKFKIESAVNSIEFPGGNIHVVRLEGNRYWAHVEVNKGFTEKDISGHYNKKGSFEKVMLSRIKGGRISIAKMDDCSSINCLIKTE